MDNAPLTPEELEQLVVLDELWRAEVTKSDSTIIESLSPKMQSVAKTLLNLNKITSTEEFQTHIGMSQSIGRYDIRSVIGVGGYGVVYLAYDPQLKRDVAIKVPRIGRMNDAASRQRLLNEVKAMAKLEHPNIVPVFDAGIQGDEVFLVLAYCPGPALDEWLKALDRPVAPRVAANIIKTLGNAIEYSHRQGILHRDIKPGNILLFDAPTSEIAGFPYIPKIADFGLAKLLDDNDQITVSMHVQGTPQYMPPEQLIQGKKNCAAALDIYSLGVLLYRLVVGRTPFQFESIEEAVRKIEHELPVSPSVIQSNVPHDLSWITMKCLEKRPNDRYKTAGDLVADLDNFLQGRPVTARAPNIVTTATHWCRKHPIIATMLSLVTIFLTTLIALESNNARNLRKTNSELSQSRNQLIDRDRRLQTTIQELKNSLEVAENRRVELQRRDTSAKQLIYSADVSAAAQAFSEKDPYRAKWILAPYFQNRNALETQIITPEFTAKYLWSQIRPLFRTYSRDTQALWAVAVSPDGKTVATAGSEGNIFLHDSGDKDLPLESFRSEPVEINSVAFTYDGKLLAAARDDGKVVVWDTLTGKIRRTFKAISGEAYSLGFLGKSYECAVTGRSNEISIWNALSGDIVRSLPVKLENPVIECMDINDEGSLLAVGGNDGHVRLFDAQGNEKLSFRTKDFSSINSVCLLPNGPPNTYSLVVADKLSRLTLVKSATSETFSLNVRDPIQTIVHLGTGLLLCGDRGGGLSLIEAQRNEEGTDFIQLKLLSRWALHDGSVQAIAIGSAKDLTSNFQRSSLRDLALSRPIYSVSRTGQLIRSDLSSIQLTIPANPKFKDFGGRSDCADIDRDGQIVFQAFESTMEWIDISTGFRQSIDTESSELTSVARIPETDKWMVGNRDGQMAIVDRTTMGQDPSTIRWRSIFSQSEFAEIEFHPIQKWYAARGGTVGFPLSIRDLETDQILFESGDCTSFAFSRDGSLMAMGRRNSNHAEVFETKNWKLIASLENHRSTITDLEFTKDGRFLVSCSDDRMGCFWDTTSWALRDSLILPGTSYLSLAISPDSRTLAISDLAGRITLWDLQTRRNLMVLRNEGVPVLQIKFVAAGSKLFAWNHRQEIEIYDTQGTENEVS